MSAWQVNKLHGLGHYEIQLNPETLKTVDRLAQSFGCTQCDIIATMLIQGMGESLILYSCHLVNQACNSLTEESG